MRKTVAIVLCVSAMLAATVLAFADAYHFALSRFGFKFVSTDDSLLCVALLKKCYNKESFEPLIRDTGDPEFYRRLRFKPYAISNINDERIDKSQLVFYCDKCGARANRTSAWRYRNRWFAAKFTCPKCARRFSGRLTFKKTYDDVLVRRRICEIKTASEKAAGQKPAERKTAAGPV